MESLFRPSAYLPIWAVLVLLWGSLGLAQVKEPPVPRDLLQNRRYVQGEDITFCINPVTLAADFNRAVAQAIAKTLLAKAKFYDVQPFNTGQPLDYSYPITEQELLIYLSDFCQVFTGFNLTAKTPEWMIFSRVYARTGFVLATLNPSYQRLEDIPADKAIGTRFISAADLKLVSYIQSLPENQRWRRYPFFNHPVLLEKLMDGSVEAALIWEPALKAGLAKHPKAQQVRTISTGKFEPPFIQFGMVMRSNETYLRSLMDQAIDGLVKDGTIERLLQEHGLPGYAGGVEEGKQALAIAPIAVGAAVVLMVLFFGRGRRRRKAGVKA